MKVTDILRKIAKTVIFAIIGLVFLVCGLTVLLYSPWAQRTLVDAVVDRYGHMSDGTELALENFSLRFPLRLEVDGLSISNAGDTLIAATTLRADVNPLGLLAGRVSLQGAALGGARYRMGSPDSAMFMTIAADSLALAPASVALSDLSMELSDAYIGGGRVDMVLKPDTTASAPSEPSTMSISLQRLRLDRFAYSMRMMPTIDTLGAVIDSAVLDNGRIDLQNQTVELGMFGGKGLAARYISPDSAAVAAFGPVPESAPSDSAAVPWTVTIDSLAFDRSRALYATAGVRPLPGLDFTYIQVDELSLRLHDFLNRGTTVRIPLEVEGRERCGVELSTSGTLDIDSVALNFSDFTLSTAAGSEARFAGKLGMGDMSNDPTLPLALEIESSFEPSDLGKMFPAFVPFLSGIPAGSPIELDADASGTTGRLGLDRADLRINRCVTLSAEGYVSDFMNPDNIGGDIALRGNIVNVTSFKNKLLDPATARELSIPPMTLRGHVSMNRGVASGNLAAVTHSGDIGLNARWDSRREDYRLHLTTNDFLVQAFMPSLGIGAVTATVQAEGHGYNPFVRGTTISADAAIASASYKGERYTDIDGKVTLADGHADVRLNSDNPNADFTLTAGGNIDGDTYAWNAVLDGRNLDLHAIGVTPEPCIVEINTSLEAEATPKENRYTAHLVLVELYYRQLSGTIALSDVDARLNASDSLTRLDITNRDMTAGFSSPCSIDTLIARFTKSSEIIQRQLSSYMIDADSIAQALPPFGLNVDAGRSNMINDILSVADMSVRSLDLDARNDSSLVLDMTVRRLSTSSMIIDSVFMHGRQHDAHLHLTAGIENQPGNMDQWHKVTLNGRIDGHRAELGVKQQNLQGKTGFDLGMVATAQPADSTISLSLRPYTPTIGYQKWSVNDSNYISYRIPDRRIKADLRMEGGNSSLAIFTEAPQATDGATAPGQDDIVLQLTDIHIQDWISLNPFAPPMKGDVSADMRLNRQGESLVGKGNAGITNFLYGRRKVADFKAEFDVQASQAGGLRADASLLVDGVRTVTIHGAMNDSTATGPLDLDLSMIHFPLATANPFLPSGTGRLSGTLNGSLRITGSTDEPIMNGYLDFDSTRVDVAMTGSAFTFSDEKIPVENSVVTFDRFAITGCNANPLTIDGTVDLTRISDMSLDLRLAAAGMQLVNTRRASRGADIYGRAFIDLDARLRGSMSFMSVDADLRILPETNVTYVMPEATSELTNYSTGDMVKFVNFTDSLAVARADSIEPSGMMMLVDADLTIEDGSIISVDLSTDGTNKVQIQSNGSLAFNMTPMNTGRLTGRLNIDKGFARYGQPPILSEQTFRFNEGSYVAFSGDIMNPTLNIHATNVIKANVTQEGANSRLVNFDVGLSVTGTLEHMDVAFDLDTNDDIAVANELETMSPEQRANQAMNLMLYKIYTGPGTKGNASLSNPLYGFLAGQLNTWAANNIKGIDLSFGIDQYDKTVNGSTSQTTSYSYQVSKSLFNDRFKIVVGGNYSTDAKADENFSQNLVNDISFEYFINKTRTMYVRLFRHTGYESILEGEITQTGVGFVYRRKLSRLGDMFLSPARVRKRIERENARLEQENNEHK